MIPSCFEALGLDREEAATYVGVGTTKFDELVRDGRMPRCRRIDGRKVWNREELRIAFKALPHEGDDTPIKARPLDRMSA